MKNTIYILNKKIRKEGIMIFIVKILFQNF